MCLALAGLLGGACAPKSETLSLFNGKDLEGWSFVVDGDVPAADVFSVEEGQILISGTPFGYMYTDAVYEDYDLEVEYAWVGKGTNSGIFLLIDETSCPFPRCVECNLQAGNAGTYVLLGGAGALEYVAPEQEGPGTSSDPIEMGRRNQVSPASKCAAARSLPGSTAYSRTSARP